MIGLIATHDSSLISTHVSGFITTPLGEKSDSRSRDFEYVRYQGTAEYPGKNPDKEYNSVPRRRWSYINLVAKSLRFRMKSTAKQSPFVSRSVMATEILPKVAKIAAEEEE